MAIKMSTFLNILEENLNLLRQNSEAAGAGNGLWPLTTPAPNTMLDWILLCALYLCCAPLWCIRFAISFVRNAVLCTTSSDNHVCKQLSSQAYSATCLFFLTGFALQTIRTLLIISGITHQAFPLRHVEHALGTFLYWSWPPPIRGRPRERQLPAANNLGWLLFAAIATFLILKETEYLGPDWKLIIKTFLGFVAMVGGGEEADVPDRERRITEAQLYRKRAWWNILKVGAVYLPTLLDNWIFMGKLAVILVLRASVPMDVLGSDIPIDEIAVLVPNERFRTLIPELSNYIILFNICGGMMATLVGSWHWLWRYVAIGVITVLGTLLPDFVRLTCHGFFPFS
ncbi:hypothetical protein F4802DRAFT_254882 [Xylaria palmicola]|nr:hypothetical protein F4802DRAFT_254882 [Xylaria palmicola]